MATVGRAMGEEGEEDTSGGRALASGTRAKALLEHHAAVLGRVAMALVGDAARAEAVLEEVAREAGARSAELEREALDGRGRTSTDGDPRTRAPALVWLLGLVRRASVIHLSRLPLRKHVTGPREEAPTTERLGAVDAIPARAALASLKPTEREALVLCLVGGLHAADVARACGVDVGTAETRIARGLYELVLLEEATLPSNQSEGERGER